MIGNWSETEFHEIGRRSRIIAGRERRRCGLREAGTSVGCWCMGAGENGDANAACPPRENEESQSPAVDIPEFHLPDMPVPWHPSAR